MNCLSLCSRQRIEKLKFDEDLRKLSKETGDNQIATPSSKGNKHSFLNQSYNFSPVLKNLENDIEGRENLCYFYKI